MDFDFTTETITPDSTNILTIGGNGGLEIPVGTTAERPVAPIEGTVRYNTDLDSFEIYSGNPPSWESIGTVASITGTANQITASASTGAITLSTPTTFIAPGSLQYTTNFGYPIESVAAAGTTQLTATLLSITTSLVTSGAAGSGVRLPVPSFDGEIHAITNNTANTILVYPAVGAYIDDEAVDDPIFINAGLSVTCVWDGIFWAILQPSFTSGNSGISVVKDQGNVIISNTGVLSISGGSTGLTPVSATSGAVTIGGTLSIGNGGTGSSTPLAAFNALSPLTTSGDTLYHNGTNNVRLPISTNGNILSIAAGLPSWITQASMSVGSSTTSTTATNVAGGAAGSVLYQTGASTTAWLPAGTSSQVLVSGSTPSWVSVITALGYTPVDTAGDTMSGTLNMGSNYITNVLDPVNPQDAATKAYVDAAASGLTVLDSVKAASTVNLTATYTDGTTDADGGLGIGATLTNSGTQAAFVIDGYTAVASDRILIKDQTNQIQNGIYTVTDIGSVSTNWVLTRSTDFNDSVSGQVAPGAYVLVTGGTTNINTGWIQTEPSPILIGTDDIIFTKFSSSTAYTAGTGLALSVNQFSNTGVLSNVAGTGISVSSATGNVTVTNTGVTSVIAGTGISVSGATGAVTISAGASTTVTVTSNYTITSSILSVFANGAAGGFTVTLPLSAVDGEIHNVKKIDETRTSIIINGNGNLIDKYSTAVLNVPFISLQLQWNNTTSRWQII